MKVHLATVETLKTYSQELPRVTDYTLSTFYYWRKRDTFPAYIYSDNNLLDSGAFTFFGGEKANWDEYVADYISFINKTDKKYFFELDIDRIVGLPMVEIIRHKIKEGTGKNPIPVWHPSRGVDYFKKMLGEFDYVALSLSGMYESKWSRTAEGVGVIHKLLDMAKEQGVKVHGLGYTQLKHLSRLKFYSVDSTSWAMAAKYGSVYYFNGRSMDQLKKPKGSRMINPARRLIFNYEEWNKFSKYADLYL